MHIVSSLSRVQTFSSKMTPFCDSRPIWSYLGPLGKHIMQIFYENLSYKCKVVQEKLDISTFVLLVLTKYECGIKCKANVDSKVISMSMRANISWKRKKPTVISVIHDP